MEGISKDMDQKVVYLDLDIVKEEYVISGEIKEGETNPEEFSKKPTRPEGRSGNAVKYVISEVKDRGGNFQCKICRTKKFLTANDLRVHMTRHHSSSGSKPQWNFDCNSCSKSFESLWTLKSHSRKVHFACLYCSMTFCHETALQIHNDNRHFEFPDDIESFPYKCTLCGESLADLEMVIKHTEENHKLPDPNFVPKTIRKNSLVEYQNNASITAKKTVRTRVTPVPLFQSPQDSTTTRTIPNSKHKPKRIRLSHLSDRPKEYLWELQQCPNCPKTLSNYECLKAHLKQRHTVLSSSEDSEEDVE